MFSKGTLETNETTCCCRCCSYCCCCSTVCLPKVKISSVVGRVVVCSRFCHITELSPKRACRFSAESEPFPCSPRPRTPEGHLFRSSKPRRPPIVSRQEFPPTRVPHRRRRFQGWDRGESELALGGGGGEREKRHGLLFGQTVAAAALQRNAGGYGRGRWKSGNVFYMTHPSILQTAFFFFLSEISSGPRSYDTSGRGAGYP